jgi:hypothetical protein
VPTPGGSRLPPGYLTPELVTVGSYRAAPEAYAAKAFLESNGVRAFVLDEHNSTLGWWNDTEVKVGVAAKDRQRADELLASIKNN